MKQITYYIVTNGNKYLTYYFDNKDWTEAPDLAYLHVSIEQAQHNANRFGGTVKQVTVTIHDTPVTV